MLLQKYERSRAFRAAAPSKQRPQFVMDRSSLAADYYDEMDYHKREAINDALASLSADGVVEVAWVKFREGRQADRVYLNLEAVEKAYDLAGIVPKSDKIALLRDILEPLADHPWPWVRKWWYEADGNLSLRKTAGLDLDRLDEYRDLARVLLALPGPQEGVPKRVLSQNLLRDSKRFEQAVEKRLLSIYKRYGGEEFDTDEEYLDSLGIVDHPKMVLLAGSIRFRLGGQEVNTGVLPGGVGLSAETVEQMKIAAVKAPRIISVENLTSYYSLVHSGRVIPLGGGPEERKRSLVVYTGGFPHRTLQKFFGRLAEYVSGDRRPNPPGVYHWGDMDYGGIRIFEYIKRNFFPGLKPYLMDAETYRRHLDTGIPFGDEYADKLRNLMTDPSYASWRPLLQAMLLHRRRVEQDSIRPEIF